MNDPGSWVLVKYWDGGSIEAVFGPYPKDRADWLMSHFADTSHCTWAVMPLLDMP